MRACLLATELARRAGLGAAARSDVYYTTLLRYVGCAATSHELAAAFGGDDVAVRARGDLIDPARRLEGIRFLAGSGRGLERLRIVAGAPQAAGLVRAAARADCEVGADLVHRAGLPDTVRDAVLHASDRFDGAGGAPGRAGNAVPAAARFAAVAHAAVLLATVAGPGPAAATLARWSGRALDPAIVALFLADSEELRRSAGVTDTWAAVVDREPRPRRLVDDAGGLDETLAGFGDAADLKSPWFQGHSRGVALLARAAAEAGAADPVLAYRAGLVHDLGRVAVPAGVWERPGPLGPDEWELVRLHPYHSGRILTRSPVLAPLGPIAARHHERMDASGYPAAVRGGDLDAVARLLAAADVWRALGEDRPHRPAYSRKEAARILSEAALDRDAVRAVLRAADGPRPSFPPSPVELTDREIDVLRRLAIGRTERQIAAELVISRSTVHTHTAHIYAKCGVTTRAGVAMFAMRHGLAASAG
jgi:HD-GYP domain-containing protein (c-di-GMP phosphodiesterase class II)